MTTQTHWFATCAFGWAAAETREEALEKCAAQFANDVARVTKNMQKEGNPGMYFWSCEVMQPYDGDGYRIEFYQPVGVECRNSMASYTTYATAKKRAWWHNDNTLHADAFKRG